MPTNPLGSINPALLNQCPVRTRPDDANELPIHITHWGKEGPDVLMVHGGVQGGIGGGPVNFEGQKPLADQGWLLRLLDRPGFGGSPSRGPDDMEEDAIVIAEHLSERSHLIGHSFGGAEALLAAARRPEAVRSLILIEPALQPMLMADPTLVGPEAVRSVGSVVMTYLMSAKTPAEFAINFARGMGRSEDGGDNVSVANIIDDADKATALGCSLLQSRAASPSDMLSAAKAVREAEIPVLLVSGGYSDGHEATCDGVAKATGGQHVIVRCGSHFVQQANPEGFNAVAHEFMRRADEKQPRSEAQP